MAVDLNHIESREFETSTPKFVVIQEVYNNEFYASEFLEEQLEKALESKIPHIIIEPGHIGDDTTKWIQVGNFLHKSAVLGSVSCLFVQMVAPKRLWLASPFLCVDILSALLYNLSWQYDPCCKYQVEKNGRKVQRLQTLSLSTSTPVILAHRDDKYRKRLHNFLTACAVVSFGWRVYRTYYQS